MLKQFSDIERVMRRHSVEPAVFVLSVDENGKPSGMAAGWNMKCSYKPPMIAVALSKNNYTQTLVRTSKEFVVAVPSPELQEQLEYFGSVSGRDVNKIEKTGIKTIPSSKLKSPLLADARINFECKLYKVIETGDHYLCVGEILAAHYNVDKDQLYFTGRDPAGNRVFKENKTHFAEDLDST